jgi:hypothetical protein
MGREQHTEPQTGSALQQAGAGPVAEETCRWGGIAEATLAAQRASRSGPEGYIAQEVGPWPAYTRHWW